jgi:aspartyl-tRNA(Asn)/glutamyl-tRNA(Gln) amidotransferase subunit C
VTLEEVKKLAALVRLDLTQDELAKFATIIPQTLETINILEELDTSQTPITSQVSGLTNVYQSNEESVNETLDQPEVLQNAPDYKNGLIETGGVFAER